MNPSNVDTITELFEQVLKSAREPELGQSAPLLALLEQSSNLSSLLGTKNSAYERIVSALFEHLCLHVQNVNQFASVPEADAPRIRTAIEQWLCELGNVLQAHEKDDDLAAALALSGETLSNAIDAILKIQNSQNESRIISEQYSVATQLEVLHIDLASLLDPVLDIGCGQDAALVTWLRQHKTKAIGLDRFVDSIPGCLKGDWNQFPYPPGQFGTVIAHLSFSLHFLHQHLRNEEQALTYAKTYMNILQSLRSRGCFVYAPGVPFIEQLLPGDKYKVSRYPIQRLPADTQGATMFEQALGESPMYAAHVTRL